MRIEDYKIVYEITQHSTIIFAGLTNILEPFSFKDFKLPTECINGKLIECRFSAYDPEGDLLEMKNVVIPPVESKPIIDILHKVPLTMILRIFKDLNI
jgi:hypothetical protein